MQARTAELTASEQHYRLLAENATGVVWAVAMDGTMTYISPSVLYLRGFSREEMLAMTWDERLRTGFPAPLHRAVQNMLAELSAGRAVTPTRYTFAVSHKDGSPVWTETTLVTLYDDTGRPIGLRGTSRNVTEREQALAALRSSEDRFARLFHASPAGISLTRRDGTYLDADDAIRHIHANMMVEYAQDGTPLRMIGISRDISDQVQVTPPDLTIASDAKAVLDVIKRLLDNAVKFTPDGGRLAVASTPEEGSRFTVTLPARLRE